MKLSADRTVSHAQSTLLRDELNQVSGGRTIVPVSVDGRPGGLVDWDGILLGVFKGDIKVTVK